MKKYREWILDHLSNYKISNLQIDENGKWRGIPKDHILPDEHRWLNIIPAIRSNLMDIHEQRSWRIQRDFKHLNSSQAFAFNVFSPFLFGSNEDAQLLLCFLGFPGGQIKEWDFEKILDQEEQTNVDVWIKLEDGRQLVIEVKLTEGEFGSAKPNDRRIQKKKHIYEPRLKGKVTDGALSEEVFYSNYQLLRNISYSDEQRKSYTVFFIPRENEKIVGACSSFLKRYLINEETSFVRVLFFEDLIKMTNGSDEISKMLQESLVAIKMKYLPDDYTGKN